MQVNFISEMTGFYRFVKSHHISNNAQLLWLQLFFLWNEAGFPDWLQVDIIRMMGMIQVNSKNTLVRARSELIDAGRIICQRGKNKQPNKYQFVMFGDAHKRGSADQSKNDHETGYETNREMNHETNRETGHLYKQNHTKPKVKKEKAAFGEYGNVCLTMVELKKLEAEFPETWEDWIKRLDVGKELKGYQYANDYAAIINWMENEENDKRDQAFQELMAEVI